MSAKYIMFVLVPLIITFSIPHSMAKESQDASSKEKTTEKKDEPKNTLPQDAQSIFSRANQAYLDGDFDKAITAYQKVLQTGVIHPDLYYNLANAYYRSGKTGLAVLFYEKALALDPADEAARSNLEIVKKELLDKVVMPNKNVVGEPLWHGFLRGLNLGMITWTFLVLWILVFAVLIARRLLSNNPLRRVLFWANVPLICVMLTFGVLLFSRIYIQEKVHHGIVVSETVPLREGPSRSSGVLMEIHAGLKVRLLNEVDNYIRVRLANGVEGFVLQGQVGQI